MRKANTLHGMDIMDRNTGEKIGEVVDSIFSSGEGRLVGFIIHNGKWINGKKFLPFSDSTRIGQDAIMISDQSLILKKEEMKKWSGECSFLEAKVMTESGKELGMIEDYMFDEEIGTIEGFEVSGGLIQDIMEGRNVINKNDLLVTGKDTILVPDYMEEKLQQSITQGETGKRTKGGESDDAQ